MNNVYRIWFEPNTTQEVCCVLVAASTEERALELARKQIECFPEILEAQYKISCFDISEECASIC